MRCKTHPKYNAKYPPRCDCQACWDMYNKKVGELVCDSGKKRLNK